MKSIKTEKCEFDRLYSLCDNDPTDAWPSPDIKTTTPWTGPNASIDSPGLDQHIALSGGLNVIVPQGG
jgi:hypothetical protein